MTVTLDPDGGHLGWMYTGPSSLVTIQRAQLFSMQFTYGFEAEVERGKGQAVPVRIERQDEA